MSLLKMSSPEMCQLLKMSAYRRYKNRQEGKFDETCGVRICLRKESKK